MKAIAFSVVALVCFSHIPPADAATVTPLVTKALPALPDNQEVHMLTVEYQPGESSAPHRHHAHTFVYVLEGRVQMQVQGGAPVTLEAGQTFYEKPEDIHKLSKNASDTEPAKFLVFFIKDVGSPITVPVK